MTEEWISPNQLYAEPSRMFGVDKQLIQPIMDLMDKLYPSNEDKYNACGFKLHNVDTGFIARLMNQSHQVSEEIAEIDPELVNTELVEKLTCIFDWERGEA